MAVVDFDHGNGLNGIPGVPSLEFHYMFEDQDGTYGEPTYEQKGPVLYENGVFDFEIYPRTADGKVFFAFINTCNSAFIADNFYGYPATQGIVPHSDRARGMPLAWSHRLVIDKGTPGFNTAQHMSDDGYADPDTGDFCYIGFDFGSAALKQTVEGSNKIHCEWVAKFFYYALDCDQSVNDALDSASQYCFGGNNFDQTSLCDGFTAVWPMYKGVPPAWYNETGLGSRMRVYGNGNIHLKRKGGAWNFDETSGTTAHDSAHGNDGTLYNGASWWYPKIGARSVYFDGNNGYMSVPSVSGLSGNTPHSIEAWVRVSSLPPNRAWILQLGNEGTGSHHWLINSAGGTQFGAWNGGQTQPTLPVGKWTHIAMTFDGTTLKSYVNGALSQSVAATFNLAGTPLILAQAHVGENYFNGAIDELHIYDYALSAGQVADHAAVASYHLNGGDYTYDNSPYGNTGTIYGASEVTGLMTSSTYSYGLSFDNYDYVNVPDTGSLDLSSAVSVEAWIKPSRLDVWQSPLEKGAHNDWVYGFYIEPSGGNIGFEIGVEGQTVQWAGHVAPVNTYLAVGRWTHIVGTADTATGKVYLYINGVKVPNEGTFSGQINTNSIPFQIGKRSDGGYFGGIIDEVRIYDRALSACEIYSHYAANIPNHWLTVDTVPFPTIPSISEIMIDGQYAGFKPYSVTINYHTVEVPEYFELPPPYGWFTFDHYIIDGSTVYNRIVTWVITKDTVVTAYYRWGY